MNVRFLFAGLIPLVVSVTYSSALAQENAALATVNGTAIPQSRLERAIAVLSRRGMQDTEKVRESLKQELIMREVVQQEALKLELDKLPEFAAALEEQRTNLLVQAYMQHHLRSNPVSDEAVKAEYDRLAAAAAEQPDKKVMSFEEAAPKVRAALEQQSMRQAAAALRKQATIE